MSSISAELYTYSRTGLDSVVITQMEAYVLSSTVLSAGTEAPSHSGPTGQHCLKAEE